MVFPACEHTAEVVFVERGLGPIGGTPEKLAEHISSEIAKYAQIVKQAKRQDRLYLPEPQRDFHYKRRE